MNANMDLDLNWKNNVPDMQKWNGILKWHPDSSPETWMHYKKYYTVEHWEGIKQFNLDSPMFFSYCNFKYINTPSGEYNRWYILDREAKPDDMGYYKACSRLGGETDFNFNKKKYDKLKKIINESNSCDDEYRYDALILLDKCKGMHHSLLNFSLMQCMGNLQTFKNEGLIKTKEPMRYEELDRLDTFVYYLNDYYNIAKEKRYESLLVERQKTRKVGKNTISRKNIDTLVEYLNSFDNIENYCDNIYFLKKEEKNNIDFIQRLIKLGEKPLCSIVEIVEYMKLAIEFWERKQKYFERKS